MNTTLLAVLLSSLSIPLMGCESAAIGDWKSKDTVANEHNELSLEDDNTGDAKVYFFADGNPYVADFDAEWEEDGDKIIVDMECQGNCASYDFEMECELNSDEDEMSCDGDNAFSTYEFDWKRD